MKILYVANMRMPTEKAHGIQIMKACEAFAAHGEEVTLWVPRRKSPISEDPFAYYGIRTRFPIRFLAVPDTVSWGKFGFTLQSVLFALRARLFLPRYDVLYGRDEIVLATLALLGARNIIWESHDGSWNRWARLLATRAKGIVVVSNGAKGSYVNRGVSPERILAVPNGIDLEEFAHPESKDAARTRLGLPSGAQIVMYIGRLDGWKGSDTFLKAASLLPDSILPVVIGGEDAQVESLRSANPQVRFLGFRPYRELADNQAAADALVVPNTAKDPISVTFTSPLKLFAHMASGRPIVASDLPSIREIAGEDAYLVTPDDPSALASGILQALTSKQSAGLAAEARMRVAGYSWESRARELTDFLAARI